MLPDIHGVDPTKFRANLGEQLSRDGSRKKRKQSPEGGEGPGEREPAEDELALERDASVEHLDIRA